MPVNSAARQAFLCRSAVLVRACFYFLMCKARVMELEELETGSRYRFADWPNGDVPRTPGVYSIWRGNDLIYVGMAGRGVQIAEINEDGQATKKTRGLYGPEHSRERTQKRGPVQRLCSTPRSASGREPGADTASSLTTSSRSAPSQHEIDTEPPPLTTITPTRGP